MRFSAPILITLLAVAAGAQPLPIPQLEIKLKGCRSDTVLFVLNGDEDNATPLTLKNGVWSGPWTEPKIFPDAYASLHLSGSRTWGRSVSVLDRSPRVAQFRFECSDEETINERIDAGKLLFTYCRQLPKNDGQTDSGDRAINEWSTSKRVIRDWRTRGETVRLLLDSTKHDCDAPALVLNNLKLEKLQKKPKPFGPKDINEALCWQHLQQKTAVSATSSNACETLDPRAATIELKLQKVD